MSATRFNQSAQRRTPLPLTVRDLEDLQKLKEPGPEREALSSLAEVALAGEVSEALLVHAVFVAGLRAIREAAEERAYMEAAYERSESAEQDYRIAHRRRQSWADED
ncbi:MAG TPA: hypothetical protein VGS19_18500 [Streptosporangiaceae bacterium]|nr:hypothetical protein [Streptosporangiaceae bacterium]